MYSLLLCAAIGLLFGGGGTLLSLWAWGWAIVFGIVVMAVCWVLLARRLASRLHPAMSRVQKQMEAGMLPAAMQSLEDMLPLSRWVPTLHGQLMAQMGALAYGTGDEKRAVALLGKASLRAADGQLLLACIHYRNGDKPRAFQILALATKVSRRHSLLHNAHAWLLSAEDRRDEAIAALGRFLQKEKNDAAAKANLLRLQNKQRMSMADFGMHWYALRLERPPASFGQMQTGRKGFRTPPKRRGG